MKNSEFLTGICRLQEGNAFAGVAWSWTSTNKLASMPVAPWWWTKAASIAVSFVGVVCVSRVRLLDVLSEPHTHETASPSI